MCAAAALRKYENRKQQKRREATGQLSFHGLGSPDAELFNRHMLLTTFASLRAMWYKKMA